MALASGQPAATIFKFSRTNRKSLNNNYLFSVLPSEKKLIVCFLHKIVIQYGIAASEILKTLLWMEYVGSHLNIGCVFDSYWPVRPLTALCTCRNLLTFIQPLITGNVVDGWSVFYFRLFKLRLRFLDIFGTLRILLRRILRCSSYINLCYDELLWMM